MKPAAPVTKIRIGQCRSLRLRDGEAYSIGGSAATRFAQADALWISSGGAAMRAVVPALADFLDHLGIEFRQVVGLA